MKRLFALLLSVSLLLSCMCGCSSEATQVPDSQIELDIDRISAELRDTENILSRSVFDHWEVAESVYDKDTHTNTVLLYLYYSTWVETWQYSVNVVYQHDISSDLWSLLKIHDAELVNEQFSPELPDKLVFMRADATEHYKNVLCRKVDILAIVSVISVDVDSGTMVLQCSILQDGESILYDEITVELYSDLDHDNMFYVIPFNYTCYGHYGETWVEEGSVSVTIYEDSMDLHIHMY